MKNISIIIKMYVEVHSSPGNVLRKHRVIPNVMVLYVFSFFSISGLWWPRAAIEKKNKQQTNKEK